MAEDLVSRADLDRVAAFLRELDRMLHPASTRPSGGYRLAPLVLPPLPPTSGFGDTGKGTGRGSSGWMATREPTPPLPGPAPDIPWVEPPPPDDDASLPAPPPVVVSTTPEAPVERRVEAPPVPGARPSRRRAPAAPADEAEAARGRPALVPEPTARPVPTPRPVAPHGESPQRPEPAPGPEPMAEGASVSVAPAAAPPPRAPRPRKEPTQAVPTAAPGPLLANPVEPAPRASGAADTRRTTESRQSEPAASDVRPPRTAPPAAPGPARRPEPVDLVVEGIDAAPPSGSDVQADAEAPVELADEAWERVSGPPVPPAGSGPRRERARLSFASAGRVQTELQRMYLDRTLRRFR